MATVRRKLDPASGGLSLEALSRLDVLTSVEIEANAQTDPDNPPLSDEELSRGVFGRKVRLLRERLGLSQKGFAERFAINVRRLQDWEQGRFAPDATMRAYLRIIATEPERVRRILEAPETR